jgi:hypothetical protein
MRFARLAEARDWTRGALNISHDGGMAIAFVVAVRVWGVFVRLTTKFTCRRGIVSYTSGTLPCPAGQVRRLVRPRNAFAFHGCHGLSSA